MKNRKTKILIYILFLFIFLDMITTFVLLGKPHLIEQNHMIVNLAKMMGKLAVFVYMIIMFCVMWILYYIASKTKLLTEYRVFVLMYFGVTLWAICNNVNLFIKILL